MEFMGLVETMLAIKRAAIRVITGAAVLIGLGVLIGHFWR
jgi:hypothetical protein